MTDTIFDDPLMTPPAGLGDDGSWDDDGPVVGYERRYGDGRATVVDIVIDRGWTAHDRPCVLLRATEYHERGRHTRDETAYGEGETAYIGCVYAPDVESFPKGYGRTYIVDCYPDDGWYRWSSQAWSNGTHRGESDHEAAVRKTETLARGLSQRAKGAL